MVLNTFSTEGTMNQFLSSVSGRHLLFKLLSFLQIYLLIIIIGYIRRVIVRIYQIYVLCICITLAKRIFVLTCYTVFAKTLLLILSKLCTDVTYAHYMAKRRRSPTDDICNKSTYLYTKSRIIYSIILFILINFMDTRISNYNIIFTIV